MQPCVVTIGNFDGVHLGHRAILARAAQLAHARGAGVTALAFDPHPASVLRPGREPLRLTSREDRIALLRQAGADDVVVLEPTPELLRLEPRDFLADLCAIHHPVAFVEGRDFRFGKGRAGDLALLEMLGRELGFEVFTVESHQVALSDHLVAPVSSSLIRWLLAHGRVRDAALALGRPFALSAAVIHGEARGRAIGVPTANLDMSALAGFALPGDGVYAGAATLEGGDTRSAAISVGLKPTFKGRSRVIEACLLDFDADLYGRRITLHFHRWLRGQRPFPDVDALRAQLERDLAQTRKLDAWGELAGASVRAI